METIINYFSEKKFRIKKKNFKLKRNGRLQKTGWSFCTEFISKFQADVFLLFKSHEKYKIISSEEIKLQEEKAILLRDAKARVEKLRVIQKQKNDEAEKLNDNYRFNIINHYREYSIFERENVTKNEAEEMLRQVGRSKVKLMINDTYPLFDDNLHLYLRNQESKRNEIPYVNGLSERLINILDALKK